MRYSKPALDLAQQVARLQERGLNIAEPDRAQRWLRCVSYYRLSAYFLPFKEGERFRKGTELNQIAGLYIFDRKLRLLVLDAIERIEVAMRSAITYEIAHAYGPFGHAASGNFSDRLEHADFMAELDEEEKRSRETFVAHFRWKYTSEQHLPVWMATELLSFGTLSMLYKHMSPQLKGNIAASLCTHDVHLASWLHTLNYVRNVCAHHKRLWNRELAIRPKLPSRDLKWPHQVPNNQRLYCVLVVTRHLLKIIAPKCKWHERLFALIDAHPEVDLGVMGFPDGWRTNSTWRQRQEQVDQRSLSSEG